MIGAWQDDPKLSSSDESAGLRGEDIASKIESPFEFPSLGYNQPIQKPVKKIEKVEVPVKKEQPKPKIIDT